MSVQIVHQPLDGQPAEDRRDQKAHRQRQEETDQIGHVQHIQHFVGPSGQHDRHRHQEGKARRRWPIEVAEHAAADGRAAARGAGEDSQDLKEANKERIQPGQRIEAAGFARQPLGQSQQQGGGQQADGGFQERLAEEGFDRVFEQVSGQQGGEGGKEDIKPEISFGGWVSKIESCSQDDDQVFPVEGKEGNQRAELNDDQEREHGVAGRDTQQFLGHQQMGGGRDGDELSQSLYDAKQEGVEKSHS